MNRFKIFAVWLVHIITSTWIRINTCINLKRFYTYSLTWIIKLKCILINTISQSTNHPYWTPDMSPWEFWSPRQYLPPENNDWRNKFFVGFLYSILVFLHPFWHCAQAICPWSLIHSHRWNPEVASLLKPTPLLIRFPQQPCQQACLPAFTQICPGTEMKQIFVSLDPQRLQPLLSNSTWLDFHEHCIYNLSRCVYIFFATACIYVIKEAHSSYLLKVIHETANQMSLSNQED